ncbi:MAG: MBL fold metallo-hydrolase [Planctomycetia bacterium]|nr:MBL fold metallo-hydrolase [Planctomycetia bacterium]
MDRRNFLSLGLMAPLALRVSQNVFAATEYKKEDTALSANYAKDASNPLTTLWQFPTQHVRQMMGYVLQTATGQTIVIDGGATGEAPYLVDFLKQECNGKVDAWFLTHAHIDHCGALAEICKKYPDALEIKDLYYNFPEQGWLDEHESGSKKATAFIFEGLAQFKGSYRKPEVNEVFQYGPLSIKCLNDLDSSLTMNAINNSSVTLRMDVGGSSLLFLGDLGYEGGDRLMDMQGENLCVDVCQMAHHGQQGVRRKFYELVKPKVTLWPTPDWLWRNDQGNRGDGSGPWKTCDTRIWSRELGVQKYYVAKDGLIKLTF